MITGIANSPYPIRTKVLTSLREYPLRALRSLKEALATARGHNRCAGAWRYRRPQDG
ncbi:hypothetical protein SAMN04487894_10136 [Niabella drilacis]|uniref:Uncharacterized protein n=1 Tax=Niabella drilacis (strain DSM 25811 / CCM 8410 / CCUG 62505 / LMG 26954 / E90) TaxID=1285928 RepID=A0A1G6HZA4_NIADE|nr:hypothetical protein SAMN04487894_10136 [Niabella drilacis]